MKQFVLMILMMTNLAFAKDCKVYDLRGFVRSQDNHLWLFVAEKTGSEKKLPIFFKTEPRFSPYVNHFIQGRFILESELQTNVKILDVQKIEDSVFDPLQQNGANTVKNHEGIECPK